VTKRRCQYGSFTSISPSFDRPRSSEDRAYEKMFWSDRNKCGLYDEITHRQAIERSIRWENQGREVHGFGLCKNALQLEKSSLTEDVSSAAGRLKAIAP
jgi:hypothetical protein